MSKFKIVDYVKGEVTFQYYQHGIFYYKTENGFTFPVPATDIGEGRLFAKDKGMLFMRWIRKALEEIEIDEKEQKEREEVNKDA